MRHACSKYLSDLEKQPKQIVRDSWDKEHLVWDLTGVLETIKERDDLQDLTIKEASGQRRAIRGVSLQHGITESHKGSRIHCFAVKSEIKTNKRHPTEFFEKSRDKCAFQATFFVTT